MNRYCRHLLLLTTFAGAAVAHSGYAVDSNAVSKNQPVMLTAREVGYDQPNATAIAIGNVEAVQGDTIVMADRITYNQNTDEVHATGHVSILQPSGDVVFADDALLKNKLEQGVVQQFRARLKDNSLFAAREGRKVNKDVTKMKNVVYSACKVCAEEASITGDAPLWQIQASKVTIDEEAQRVKYQNAFVDVYGVPVMYTPYFSHPTPDAPSESGLLTPQYFHATDLGNVVKQPVYVSIAPNMDMTLTPWYMSGEKPMLEGEFRNLTSMGYYEVHGAITDTYNRDDSGNIIPGSETRGYIEAHGKLQLSDHWDAGVDAERTTDDTFLQLYRFAWQDMLTSRLYAERIEDRDYAVIETMAFQGLEVGDVGSQSPYILPQASMHLESDPLFMHSRLTFDSNVLVLQTDQAASDQRVSSTVGWKIPYITSGGQVFQTNFTLRGDAYNVEDQTVNIATGETYNGDLGRVIPQADFNWRYPLINRFGEGKSLMIAPVVELVASPDLHISSKIPNEDSQVAELSDINLFSPNRFTGLDEVESGLRGTYGMRGQLQFANDKFMEWLLGEAYQDNAASPFPITQTADQHFSDYIGRLALKYKWMDIAYSFRADRDTMALISNEVTTNFSLKPVNFEVDYIALHDEPLFGDRKEIFGSTAVDVTPNWTWTTSGRKDLGSTEETPANSALPVSATNPLEPSAGTVGLSTGLMFHNECVTITTNVGRSYISELDVKPSTTVSVLLVLKNFSTPNTGSNANNLTGSGNIGAISAESSTAAAPASSQMGVNRSEN